MIGGILRFGLSSLSNLSMLKEDFITEFLDSRGLLRFEVVLRFIYMDMFSSAIFCCLDSSFLTVFAIGVRAVFELTNRLLVPPIVPLILRVESTCSWISLCSSGSSIGSPAELRLLNRTLVGDYF